ncbi:hypothetical protein BVI434_250006 [Burkholderia vietnamiensis]|nr:hypothetical protein BVI434_250006 [Burkholderia vietnamiensis]
MELIIRMPLRLHKKICITKSKTIMRNHRRALSLMDFPFQISRIAENHAPTVPLCLE